MMIKYKTTHSVRHRYAAQTAEEAKDAAAGTEDVVQAVEVLQEAAAASEAVFRWSEVASMLHVSEGVNIIAGTTSAATKYQCALQGLLAHCVLQTFLFAPRVRVRRHDSRHCTVKELVESRRPVAAAAVRSRSMSPRGAGTCCACCPSRRWCSVSLGLWLRTTRSRACPQPCRGSRCSGTPAAVPTYPTLATGRCELYR